jgi:hypothetical protein
MGIPEMLGSPASVIVMLSPGQLKKWLCQAHLGRQLVQRRTEIEAEHRGEKQR